MASISSLIKQEIKRQKSVINLIASENYPSKAVLAALATPLAGKYAEGKPHQRYYCGNRIIDKIEIQVQELSRKVFKIKEKDWSVNVQAYSGSIANLASYIGALELGDTVLAMSLEHGGHLTHGHPVSLTGKLFSFIHYGVDKNGFIDYEQISILAKKHKPRLIVCGATAYSRKIDFKKFREIADSIGAFLLADISHIAGLIAGGVHPSPFPFAHIVTTTTHKTLRGPRGAIIFSRRIEVNKKKNIGKKELLSDSIDKAIFPGLQGGPHMHTISAIGVCLEEAITSEFKLYAKQIVKNAKALSHSLKQQGFSIISGGTDNHLFLVDLSPLNISGKEASDLLEEHGIIVNKNMIPNDSRKPWDPSGIRLGTPAVTTQGLKEKDMLALAAKIAKILKN